MKKTLLEMDIEELAEKKEFLLELSNRLQTEINKGSKKLQKTLSTMNKVVAEIAQLENEIKELQEN